MKQIKKAFTLVELIVVIVILAILASIAFINLQDYPKMARDAGKKSDLVNIKKVLDIHNIQGNGNYPLPDEPHDTTTQSGWTIGTFGTGVVAQLKRGGINPIPKDPVTGQYYKYAVNTNRNQFKLISSLEETGKSYIVTNTGVIDGGTIANTNDNTNTNDTSTNTPTDLATSSNAYGNPDFEFAKKADGTPSGISKGGDTIVLDRTTGLMWESEGSNGETPAAMNWTDAKARCAGLNKGGFEDWRLPDMTELRSIVDYTRYNPAVDTTYFELASSYYWSSTTGANYTSSAWILNFNYGNDSSVYKTLTNYVLCVR